MLTLQFHAVTIDACGDVHRVGEVVRVDSRLMVAVGAIGGLDGSTAGSTMVVLHEVEGQLVVAQKEAEGIKARGEAQAKAKEKLGLAEVQPQITLAKEIGENEGYQTYLIEIKKVEASQAVGVEQARNLGNAQIKIVANSGGGNIQEGVSSVMDLFSAKGGQVLGSMLETFAGTEQGQALLGKLLGDKPVGNNTHTEKK